MPRQTPKPEQLQRELAVLELRKTGANWRSIAEAVGYSHASAARKAYLRAYDKTLQAPADELRDLELERLDRLQMTYWKPAIEGDLKAAYFIKDCISERVRILGLAAPTKIQAEVVTYDAGAIDADIERIIRQFENPGGALALEAGTSENGATPTDG